MNPALALLVALVLLACLGELATRAYEFDQYGRTGL